MLKYVSDKIKGIIPYAPGKPLEELERELEQVLEPPLDTSVRHRQELHALPRTS